MANGVRHGPKGEPDRPVLSARNQIEGNSYRIYFEDVESGDSPILKYNIRYREEQASHWLNDRVNATDYYLLKNLKWGTHYHVEVEAENEISVSKHRLINFTTPEDPHPPLPVNSAIGDNTKLGTGGIIGIILVIFLVAFAAVDVACYYTNRCGILMCIAVNVLGRQDPGAKRLDQEVGVSVVRVKGHGNLTDSLEVQKIKTKRSSDKLPLTKSETAPVQGSAVNQL
ncbi:neural cell adhesion molecule 1-like [Rhincodon typus]|uniref:neural cell adhesion molecule 1-like n=1 Tax=Rhincodon typus TaxID=259920 RepID=UPI00202FDF28|nr:neural cell adhesion molecule 1-like [Rhincodon typus]